MGFRLRLLLLLAVLPQAVLLAACAEDAAPDAEAAADAPWDARRDPRLAWLFAPCARSEPFTASTADPIGTLVSKLETGQRDPMRRAKEELGAIGAPALPELARLVDRLYADTARSRLLENALDPLARMETDAARPLVLRCLEHPVHAVRVAAVRALRPHAEPADTAPLAALLPLAHTEREQAEIVAALARADPERLAADLAGWLERGEYAGAWANATRALLAELAPSERPVGADAPGSAAVAVDLAPLERAWTELPPDARPFAAAALVVAGSEESAAAARAWLDAELEALDPQQRTWAVEALRRIAEALPEHGLALAPRLARDENAAVRVLAAEAVAAAPPTDERRRRLTAGLADPAAEVRQACLEGLVATGAPAGVDQALAALADGDAGLVSAAMRALRPRMAEDPDLAERALGVLVRHHEEVRAGTFGERIALLEAIGLVPHPDAARYLLDLAAEERDTWRGIPAHRWLTRQAGNTGPAGRPVLLERRRVESDAERRLDLLEALSFERSDATRALLRGLFDDERASGAERLYAAEALVRLGPTAEVAPFLKRRALATEDPEIARALYCLLWTWYG